MLRFIQIINYSNSHKLEFIIKKLYIMSKADTD